MKVAAVPVEMAVVEAAVAEPAVVEAAVAEQAVVVKRDTQLRYHLL